MSSVQADGLGALGDVLALAEDSGRTYASRLAPDVRCWLASPAQGLSAAATSVSGVRASTDALARLGAPSLTVVASVHSDRACWAELARQGDGFRETCIAGLTYDAGGRVSRVVWLRAPLVPRVQIRGGDGAPPDARPVL